MGKLQYDLTRCKSASPDGVFTGLHVRHRIHTIAQYLLFRDQITKGLLPNLLGLIAATIGSEYFCDIL